MKREPHVFLWLFTDTEYVTLLAPFTHDRTLTERDTMLTVFCVTDGFQVIFPLKTSLMTIASLRETSLLSGVTSDAFSHVFSLTLGVLI